jgi:hypothetical protein
MLERLALGCFQALLMLIAAVLLPLVVGWIIIEALWARFIKGETVHVRD